MNFNNTPKPGKVIPVDHVKEEVPAKKKEKRKSRFNWKVKGSVWAIMLMIIGVGIIQAVIWTGSWFDQNKIVPHQVIQIKISPPFTIESRIVTPVGEGTPSASLIRMPVEKVEAAEPEVSADAQVIVAYIHKAESSDGNNKEGLHITCRNKGMSNEYGYRALDGFCFNNDKEAVATVTDWVERSLAVRGILETLCRYNTGSSIKNCTYAEQFKTWVNGGK